MPTTFPFRAPRPARSIAAAAAPFLLLVGVCAAAAPAAQAQLLLTISPDSLNATPGSTVTFSGSLKNNFTARLYLNAISFNGDAAIDGDETSFFAPDFLEANATYTGNLFNVSLSGSATPGTTYQGLATIQGGSNPTEQQLLDTRPFNVNAVVVTPTPPAGAVFAVLGGVMCGADGLRRRRKRSHIAAR